MKAPETNSTFEYISDLLNQEFRIIPLYKGTKIPYDKHLKKKLKWHEQSLKLLKRFWTPERVDKYNYGLLPTEYQVVIDVDLYDKKTGRKSAKAAKFLKTFQSLLDSTYQERTQHGYHYFFISETPLKFMQHGDVELRTDKKQTAIYPSTGENMVCTPISEADTFLSINNLKPLPLEILEYFLTPKNKNSISSTKNSTVSLKKIKKALRALPADDYNEVWVPVCFCLKHHSEEIGRDLFPLFDSWSATSEKYRGTNDCKRKWDSVLNEKEHSLLTISSLFHLAKIHGSLDSIDLIDEIPTPLNMLDDAPPSKEHIYRSLQNKALIEEENLKIKLPYDLTENTILPPEFYYNCPSPIGKMTEVLCSKAQRPLPGSTFAALLSLQAHIMSHSVHWIDESISPVNYFICVAGSSSGKDYPQSAVDKIVKEINMTGVYNEFRTELSTYMLLQEHGSIFYLIDEVEDMLRAVTASNVESYKRNIPNLLTKIWSYSSKTYRLPRTADKKDEDIVIESPRLNFVGFSQHNVLECFSNRYFVERGFTQRFLYIIEPRYVPIHEDRPFKSEIPAELLEYYSRLHFNFYTSAVAEGKTSSPYVTEQAHATFKTFSDYVEKLKRKAAIKNDTITEKIWGKAVEYAKRLALSLVDESLHITEELATWCCDFMRHQCETATAIYFNVEDKMANISEYSMLDKLRHTWQKLSDIDDNSEVTYRKLMQSFRGEDSRGRGFKHYYQVAQDLDIMSPPTEITTESGQKKKVVFLLSTE